MIDVLSDEQRIALITQIVERADDRSSFHGYPANASWLWGIVEKAVDATLMAERDERSVEEIFECQDILEVFTKDPPKPPINTLGVVNWQPSAFVLNSQAQPSIYVPPAPRGGFGPPPQITLTKIPEAEPDKVAMQYKTRLEQYRIHSPNWLNGPTHKDGVPFFVAPKPRRRHKCWPQTSGTNTHVMRIEFCPCGAFRMDGRGDWIDRNIRPGGI